MEGRTTVKYIDIMAGMRKGVELVKNDPLNKNRDGRVYAEGYEAAVDDLADLLNKLGAKQ